MTGYLSFFLYPLSFPNGIFFALLFSRNLLIDYQEDM